MDCSLEERKWVPGTESKLAFYAQSTVAVISGRVVGATAYYIRYVFMAHQIISAMDK